MKHRNIHAGHLVTWMWTIRSGENTGGETFQFSSTLVT